MTLRVNSARAFIYVAPVLAAALAGSSTGALSQPAQQSHFICAYPAGSSSDSIVRFIAEKVRPQVGGVILVENKPGANGNLATEFLARAKPDGQTILIQRCCCHSGRGNDQPPGLHARR